MKTRFKILIVISIIFVSWIGVSAPNICIFVDGPTPDWLGSHNGCGPLITYEIQNYFGILWQDSTPTDDGPLVINVTRGVPNIVILDDSIEKIIESCSGKFGIPLERKTLWINETHKIISDRCELEKRFNSGVSIDRTVYPIPIPEPLDIASIEDGHIRLNPVDTCAGIDIDRLTLDELNQRYPATFTTKSGKTYEIKFLSINDDDFKEMPVISELIRATHQIPFPLNDGITASKGLIEDPDWIEYLEWYDQKKTEQFNLDEIQVRGFVYNEEYYSIGFSIC